MEGSRAFSCAIVDGSDVWVESSQALQSKGWLQTCQTLHKNQNKKCHVKKLLKLWKMMSKLSGKNSSSESQKSPAFPQCRSIALIAEQWWTPADHRREANGKFLFLGGDFLQILQVIRRNKQN